MLCFREECSAVLLLLLPFLHARTYPIWKVEELRYFDNLRFATSDLIDVAINPGSNVLHVSNKTAQNDSFSSSHPLPSYRLCHLTSMLPASDGDGNPQPDFGLYTEGAGFLAMIHFNAKMDAVVAELTTNPTIRNCNVRLTMDFLDTKFSPIEANRALIDNVVSRSHSMGPPIPSALVGATRSAVSGPLSILSSAYSLPLISYGSTSSQLDNKDVYRYFGRTVPTNAGDSNAAAAYLREVLNVTHVGVLYVRDEYGSSFNAEFTRAAYSLTPPMHVVSTSYDADASWESTKEAVDQLADTGFNFFFGIISTPTFNRVMRIVRSSGIAGPGKFWLCADAASQILRDGFSYNARTEGDLIEATTGMAVLSVDIDLNRAFDGAWTTLESDDNIKEYFVSKQPNYLDLSRFRFSSTPSFWEYLQYDAVIALGFAACNAKSDFFTGGELYDAFKNTSFVGASGRVSFDQITGTRDFSRFSYKVSNVVANPPDSGDRVTFSSTRVAFQNIHDTCTGKCLARDSLVSQSSSWMVLQPTVYADGGHVPPTVLPPKLENENTIGVGVRLSGIILGGVTMLMSVACATWTLCYWRTRVVRKSQPEFLIMLCCGTFIMSWAIAPLSLQEPVSKRTLDAACMAAPWLFSVGFVISFSALFSKALRMNKIFYSSRQLRRIQVRVRHVLFHFLVVLTFNVIILAAWTAVAPLRWHRTALNSLDRYGRSVESYGHCVSKDSETAMVFQVILFVANTSCLVFAAHQSYTGRKVPSEYHEGFYVLVSVSSILQAFAIGIPVVFAASVHPAAHFLIRAVLIVIICSAILFPLFIPKILRIGCGTRTSAFRRRRWSY